jgi:hypothetical protein
MAALPKTLMRFRPLIFEKGRLGLLAEGKIGCAIFPPEQQAPDNTID